MNNLEKVDSRYIYMRCCDTDSRDKSHEQTDQGSSAVSFGILILSLYIVCYRCYLFHGLLVRSLGPTNFFFCPAKTWLESLCALVYRSSFRSSIAQKCFTITSILKFRCASPQGRLPPVLKRILTTLMVLFVHCLPILRGFDKV